jgi:hypothetical protein
VQEHLRHADIQTTTLYTRLTQEELQKVVGVFDRKAGLELEGQNRLKNRGGDPGGIRTRDLDLERVASLARLDDGVPGPTVWTSGTAA